ncbi:hypothetical protein HPB47_022414 [Ixodes persulcatus]|uniref:Uncharacterized protein n=1 Tax=Ixodes persulcatus TaxID=34615 RepID=A0AC60Q9Y1_IXOPE|nr:hypothetical protein HPB47_022414 [Ixodes persulcatus]
MASLDHPEAPVNVPQPEDVDLQATETSPGQPGSLSLTGNTAAAPAAAVAAPPSIIIRPQTNPFAPLMDLEHAQHEEGKLLNLSSNVRVISTTKHGQKRAPGTLSSVSTAASTRNGMSTNQTRGMEMETAPTPSDASTQDSTLEESDWQRVTYRRKKNSTLASAISSSGRPMYQHTVILKPTKPCRIIEEHFIKIDEAITRHISTYLKIDKQHDLPKFLTRYLNRSNQIAVDAAETRVRDALVTIDHLSIKGQAVPFQAYETIRHGQIRGIIRNAGGMLATERMQNLHCRKCEILSARPLGEHQHQLPQADLDQRFAQLEQIILQKVQQAIENAIERPTSRHVWACPNPSFPKVVAIELWRSLLAYIQDPAAPPRWRTSSTPCFTRGSLCRCGNVLKKTASSGFKMNVASHLAGEECTSAKLADGLMTGHVNITGPSVCFGVSPQRDARYMPLPEPFLGRVWPLFGLNRRASRAQPQAAKQALAVVVSSKMRHD